MKTFHYTLIQIVYCILICAVNGYATVYLLDKQLTNTFIGTILSLSNILGILAQQVIASFVDKSNGKYKAKDIVLVSFLFIALLSIGLRFFNGATFIFVLVYTGILMCMGILAPFISAMIFDFEKHGITINFGFARGMGSASYAIASLILGTLTAMYGISWLPNLYIILGILLTLIVFTFRLPKTVVEIKQQQKTTQQQNFFKKYPLLRNMLIAVVLLFFGFNLTNSYLIQIVTHVGGNQSHLGIAMFLAAIVELPAMSLNSKLSKKLGHYNILIISAIFFGIKHTLTWLAGSLIVIYLAQLLQFCSYAFFLPSSVFLVSEHVQVEDSMKGQALMTGAISLGGVGASAIGGILLDSFGVSTTLLCAALVTWIGVVLLISTMKKMEKENKVNG